MRTDEATYFPPGAEIINEDGTSPRFFDHMMLDVAARLKDIQRDLAERVLADMDWGYDERAISRSGS